MWIIMFLVFSPDGMARASMYLQPSCTWDMSVGDKISGNGFGREKAVRLTRQVSLGKLTKNTSGREQDNCSVPQAGHEANGGGRRLLMPNAPCLELDHAALRRVPDSWALLSLSSSEQSKKVATVALCY